MTRDFAHLHEDPALTFTVPGAPVGWQRTGTNGKRRFTPAKTAAAEQAVGYAARVAMARDGVALFTGPLIVTVAARMDVPASWPKRKRDLAMAGAIFPTAKPDIDNVVKLILDALNGVAWKDDAAVVKIEAVKVFAAAPCLDISIKRAA